MNIRTTTRDGDDIWPVITVWLPTAVLTYFGVYWGAKQVLLQLGYGYEMPVEIVGGGASQTVFWTAASYHAGTIGISAMLAVLVAWAYRDHKKGGGP